MNENLMYNVDSFLYGGSYMHQLIINDSIGENGKNLTIMVLTYNRSKATIDLLSSVQKKMSNFEGEILLIDNNSDKKELNTVKKFIEKNIKIKTRIIEFEKNYGVAAGRNKGIKYVNTDWVMSLDNDIYLVGNPLKSIDETIKLFGCHFLNIPLMDEKGKKYFLNGGHLYLETDGAEIDVGGGSLFEQSSIKKYIDPKPSLSTFFAGGTSVFKKQTFIDVGMYDEGFFIGFEDTDLSLRLFQKGYKIGNCTGNFLIHNHVIDNSAQSVKYEKNRFSSDIIYNSAMHFEDKWGYKVWNKNVALWLEQRQSDLNVSEKKMKNKHIEKPKIALVVDVYNWCFWNISKQLEKYLSDKFDLEIVVMENFNEIYDAIIYLKKFDLVHFFWRGNLLGLNEIDNEAFVNKYGISYDYFKKEILNKMHITTSIYDHLYLDDEIEYTKKILSIAKEYTTSSNILNNIYKQLEGIKNPDVTVTDGIDFEKFKCTNINKYKEEKNYIAFCKSSVNKKWYLYDNDNDVIEVTFDKVKEKGKADILIYSCVASSK